ncbi:hypothetical protein ACFVEL_25125 [Bacillus thuringiensis]|uniref:hypothetical protein n=1 Tax=Bacillus cereus group TaxID=86661 RepID=UPI00084CA0EE|nr:hypothetical protein [Bacillus cereus]OED05348.1 hypothetical protein A9756_08185 [Bacillus cereus]
MINIKKLASSLLVSALFIIPTSASAAGVYGVVTNKWDANSSTIQNAVLINDNKIYAVSSNDYAFLSTENGQTEPNTKGKVSPSFPTKGMVKIDNNRIFIAGMQGKWKVVGTNGKDVEKGKLSDPRTPRFVKKLLNGKILLVHNDGYYTLLDTTSKVKVARTGKWQNNWNINDTVEFTNGKLLMVGDKGNYQVMSTNDGKVIESGDWGFPKHGIQSIDQLTDGKMLAVGEGSNIILFDKDGKKIDDSGTVLSDKPNKKYKWDKVVALEEQHALVISSSGDILLVHVDDTNNISIKAQTKINNYAPDKSIFKVKNDRVFVTLTGGRFIIFQIDLDS